MFAAKCGPSQRSGYSQRTRKVPAVTPPPLQTLQGLQGNAPSRPLINIRIVAKTWPAVSYLHINPFLILKFWGGTDGRESQYQQQKSVASIFSYPQHHGHRASDFSRLFLTPRTNFKLQTRALTSSWQAYLLNQVSLP